MQACWTILITSTFGKYLQGFCIQNSLVSRDPFWDQKALYMVWSNLVLVHSKYIGMYCPCGTSQLSIWVDFNTLQRGKINPKVYLELEVATDRRGRQRLPLFVFICFAFEILQWGLTFRLKVNPEVGGGLAIVGVCYCLYFNPSFLIAPRIHYLWLIQHLKWIWIFNRSYSTGPLKGHMECSDVWLVVC